MIDNSMSLYGSEEHQFVFLRDRDHQVLTLFQNHCDDEHCFDTLKNKRDSEQIAQDFKTKETCVSSARKKKASAQQADSFNEERADIPNRISLTKFDNRPKS